jgi:L-amino acid N-acyltransferase YncA
MRPATATDADAICAIYNAAIAERTSTFETEPRSTADFEARIADRGLPILVATGGDGDIGEGLPAGIEPEDVEQILDHLEEPEAH